MISNILLSSNSYTALYLESRMNKLEYFKNNPKIDVSLKLEVHWFLQAITSGTGIAYVDTLSYQRNES